jgi:hypothetical protein
MRVLLGVLAVIVVPFAAFYAWIGGERTDCFAQFKTREEAELAAMLGRFHGFGTDVEESGPEEHSRTSQGGEQIAVILSDGETDEDAKGFVETFGRIVGAAGGKSGDPRRACGTTSLGN